MKRIISLLMVVCISISFIPTANAEAKSIVPVTSVFHNGHTYQLYDNGMTWQDAKEFCERNNGYLVTITSESEQKAIERLLVQGNKKQYWIGIKTHDRKPLWITGEKYSYSNWDRGEPNNSRRSDGNYEYYGHIYNEHNPHVGGSARYKWNDIYYDNTFPGQEHFFSLNNVGFILEKGVACSTKPSKSTTSRAPVIKYVELQKNNASCDILNRTLNVPSQSTSKVDIIVDVDWKGATKPKVYITQGAQTKGNYSSTREFSSTTGRFNDIVLASRLKPDMPVYILAMDEQTGFSSSILTKINIIDLSKDDMYKEVMQQKGVNIKLGKDMLFKIPENIPIVGGLQLTWKIEPLPITVAYESSNKMSVTIGLDIDTIEKDGLTKLDGFQFKDFKKIIKDYSKEWKKYGNDIEYAAKKQSRSLKQLRNDFRMSEANKRKNKGLTMSAWGGKILKSTGNGKWEPGIEAIGYAEVNKVKGEWDWAGASGYIMLQVKVGYTYNGQAFIWLIPVCYSFGGDVSAGLNAGVKGMTPEFMPHFESYLLANLDLNVSGGVGISEVVNFNTKATADLGLHYGLLDSCTDYDELLLSGDVSFNVELLGKEVESLTVAELREEYGVIYSEDPAKYSYSWIKPNRKQNTLGLMSIDEPFNNYSADTVYENEARDYLSNPMQWQGDMPPLSLFSADYTNKNQTLLASNVYPQAQPAIFTVDNKKVLVFTVDSNERTAENKQMLVYSVYNDENATWSAPLPVNDDGTADFYPSISGEYLVWQNQKSVMSDGLSLAEIGRQGEIVIAKWNGNGFDTPVSLTDNDELDTLPKVCANGDEISVVWLKNSADDILGVDGNTSIIKKIYNGSVWSEETALKNGLNAVTDLSVGYSDNTLNVAYVHDIDDSITTINDREVYLIAASEKQITSNEVLDSNAIISNGKLYWYSENNIHYINIADGAESTVFEEARYTLADDFTVSENNGNIAILWSGTEGEGSEIKGVLYQDGAWGDIITVSELGAYSKYPTCVLENNGNILTSFTAESDDITSLYTIGLFPSYDLAVTDIYYDESTLAVNNENEFELTLSNAGELAIDGYTINVYNEDNSLNNSIVFDDTIISGESKAVICSFITGDAITTETLRIEAVMNQNEEYIYDNNTDSIKIGNGDISLEDITVYEELPTSYAIARVANKGFTNIENISVNLRAENVEGEIISSENIKMLEAEQTVDVRLEYNPADYENVEWHITVEADIDEISTGNNNDYFINECAVNRSDYEISILNYSYADNKLTVNAFAKNNTNDILSADAIFAVYSSDGRIKGITIQPLSVDEYSDTGIDVWWEEYTYASGDYVKMFMWSEVDNLKTLVNAEQVNMAIN